MKQKRLYIFPVIFCLFLNNSTKVFGCGYNYVSDCATQLSVEANGQTITFFAGTCTWLQNFQNYDFGTVNDLTLKQAMSLTWESCSNQVLNASLFYRIYQTGTTPGSFLQINLLHEVDGGSGNYRNRTFDSTPNTNLLAGLAPGVNFSIEIYFKSDIDFQGNSAPDGILTRDNNGQFFKAFFKKGGLAAGISIDLSNKTNPKCNGNSDGAITASASGGTTPYSFSWSNGKTTALNNNLPAGNYTVTVTASNGISATATTTLTQSATLAVSLNITNESNAAANNGSATAIVSGGTTPYIYVWNSGAAAATISNLDAGTYSLTVSDANGCSNIKIFTVNTSGNVPTGYCASAGLLPWNEYIGEVKLENLDNLSGKSSFADFTNLSPTQLAIGGSFVLTLKTGTGWFPNQEFWAAWLDTNRNGIFETGEIILNQTSTPPIQGLSQLIANQTFTIPATAAAGITRLRVAVKRGSQPTPCETFQMGEVEDYFINLLPATPGCNLTATVSNLACQNNNTPTNPADDLFTFTILANKTGGGTGWTANVNGVNFSGNYGVAKSFGPYNIAAGNLNFTVADIQNPTNCSTIIAVAPPATCSSNSGSPVYCTSKSAFPWQEWISKVIFSNINKPSGKADYSNFTSSIAAVVRGQNYPIQLFASFSWDAPPQYFRVWIDYNRDGIFQTATETAWQGILSGAAKGAVDAQLTGNFTIPANATLGETRMRISMKRGAYPDPCEAAIPFGEVEDYSVNIAASLVAGKSREITKLDLADFSIFPNPISEGEFSLNLEKLKGEAVQILVNHTTGRTVFFEKIEELENDILKIDATDWPTGEYFISIQSPKMHPVVKKLVVVRR